MTFDELVDHYYRTCAGWPTQYEGVLADGRSFYFRHRYQGASLGIGSTIDEAVCDADETYTKYGDHPMSGCVNEEEFKGLFVQLHRAHVKT